MKTLNEILSPIQSRLRIQSMVRGGTTGLLFGAAVAVAIAGLRLGMPQLHWAWAFVPIFAFGILGLLVGVASRRTRQTAARLIDDHYDLKDGSITALQFTSEGRDDSIGHLQLEETQRRLQGVDPLECVPIQASKRQLGWAGALSAAAAFALVASSWLTTTAEAKSVLPLAQSQATLLRETMLPELEELAQEQEDPEIEKLVQELKEKIEDLDTEAMDEGELLATLSEMEQSLAEMRESMQLELTDAMMNSLAESMKPADPMRAAANAIEAKDYEQASKKLEAVDPDQIGDKQRRAVADSMKKMVASLNPGQKGSLSQTIMQLADDLSNKNTSGCKKCMSKLAKACRKQGQCNKIGQCMSKQLNRLSQCKGQCRGQCQSESASKSERPSTKAGKGSSGNPLGDQSKRIDSTRRQEELIGQQGEGASETEILEAPEGKQDAARAYSKKYDDFRRQAEAVLENEPLPLGHRETVRKYFESIRPDNDEAAVVGE